MKDIKNKVDKFQMPFGQYKDCFLNEVPVGYLIWFTNTNNISRWHKMLVDYYLDNDMEEEEKDETSIDLDRQIQNDIDNWDI